MNTKEQVGSTPTAQDNFTTMMGGIDLTVTLQDGSSETVKVLQLPIEKYPELAAKWGDEQAQIDLYCSKPSGWAKTLTVASHDQVMEEAEKVNGDFFTRWLRRRMGKVDALRPGALDKVFETSTLPSSSPKRPLRPA